MDVDQDGDSDLVLGQLRDPSRLDQFSIIPGQRRGRVLPDADPSCRTRGSTAESHG